MNDNYVKEWIRHAKEDLDAASNSANSINIRCYHSQQSIEKMLKAALILEGIEFERTHDLNELLKLLPDSWRVKNTYSDFEKMTSFAVRPRYPDDLLTLVNNDAKYAASMAREIYDTINGVFKRRGILP